MYITTQFISILNTKTILIMYPKGLSYSVYDSTLKVANTIADLDKSADIKQNILRKLFNTVVLTVTTGVDMHWTGLNFLKFLRMQAIQL